MRAGRSPDGVLRWLLPKLKSAKAQKRKSAPHPPPGTFPRKREKGITKAELKPSRCQSQSTPPQPSPSPAAKGRALRAKHALLVACCLLLALLLQAGVPSFCCRFYPLPFAIGEGEGWGGGLSVSDAWLRAFGSGFSNHPITRQSSASSSPGHAQSASPPPANARHPAYRQSAHAGWPGSCQSPGRA